jgi:hypothetical protein
LQLGLKITDPILSAKNYASNINMVKNFLNNRLQSIGQQAGPYAQGELGITPKEAPQTMQVGNDTYILNPQTGKYRKQ